ncbi:MAG: sugar ABC transporter permease, partial [Angelakisella sp.]
VFLIYPAAYSAVISLYEWDGLTATKTFVGLDNYIKTIRDDPIFKVAISNNIKWAILSEIIPIILGLTMALCLNVKLKGFGFFRGGIFFPSVLSISTIGLIWRWMYDPNLGLINAAVQAFSGGKHSFNWLEPPEMAIYFLIIAGSWAYSGLCMILFMAGIKAIPESTIEASMLDGASSMQRVFYIILPQMKNSLNIVVTFTLINSFKVFDLIYVMTAGGPGRMTNVMATWSYYSIFRYYNYGTGSAMSIMLAAILLIGSLVVNRVFRLQKN